MTPRAIVIVDYGMGNLFSVKHACRKVGADAIISSNPVDLREAAGIILPGVGAFGDAMEALRRHRLVDALQRAVEDGKLLLGICLGMQLLMQRSYEFGEHQGLGLVPGKVIRLQNPTSDTGKLKVPHVGWSQLKLVQLASATSNGSILEGIPDGSYMYFVHSYHVCPENRAIIVATTKYGDVEFCSVIQYQNIYGVQFHPERSGPFGLKLYSNFYSAVLHRANLLEI